jgi:hypothetical protein
MKNRSYVMKATRILQVLSGLALLAVFASGSACATTALFPKKSRAPITIFDIGQRIPRNSRALEFARSSGGSHGIVIGGPPGSGGDFGSCRSKDNAIREIKKRARAAGANAVSILDAERDRSSGCFEIRALLLDMIDITNWPRICFTEDEIKKSLDARGNELDEIEGIWESSARTETYLGEGQIAQFEADLDWLARRGFISAERRKALSRRGPVPTYDICTFEQRLPEEQSSYRVAIMRAAGDPFYPYAAYILDPEIPEWQPGFLKAWLRKGPGSSGYEAIWYRSTFRGDMREFHPDDSGTLKASAILVEFKVDFSIEQTLTRIYPPQR